jgi:hypothetical protein
MSGNINPKDFELKEENKEDFKQSTIVRKNVETEFTLALIEDHKGDLVKMDKELTSQADLCKATCENIERNHEFVKDLTPEQIHHVWMYQENKTVVDNAEGKLKEVKEQLTAYEELLDMVYTKFGFVKSEVKKVKHDKG